MEQPVKDDEVAIALAAEDGSEIELDIRLSAQPRRCAQQAEGETVSRDAPELAGAVEELLDKGVRREARSAGGIDAAEFLACPGDVDRRGVVVLAGPVRNGVGLPVEFVGAWVAHELVAEAVKQREHPLLPGQANGTVVFGHAGEAALKDVPPGEGITVGLSDVVAQGAVVGEAEVAWALTVE